MKQYHYYITLFLFAQCYFFQKITAEKLYAPLRLSLLLFSSDAVALTMHRTVLAAVAAS